MLTSSSFNVQEGGRRSMLAGVVTRAGSSAINVVARSSVRLTQTIGLGEDDQPQQPRPTTPRRSEANPVDQRPSIPRRSTETAPSTPTPTPPPPTATASGATGGAWNDLNSYYGSAPPQAPSPHR